MKKEVKVTFEDINNLHKVLCKLIKDDTDLEDYTIDEIEME